MLLGSFQPPEPQFKGFAESWGWKEVPMNIKCIPEQILFSGFVVENVRAAWVR
jgi:hypothetical protein